jgi:L-fucose mutarotase
LDPVLRSKLLQPEILEALGRAGHSSKILIADGNYPFATKLGPNARLVSLNLSPGIVTATEVLEAIVGAVPIEAATIMQPVPSGPFSVTDDPPIWAEFRRILDGAGVDVPLEKLDRFPFFDAAGDTNVALTVATAEQRLYSNILLQIGVVFPEPKQ